MKEDDELKVHGSMFLLFKKFILTKYGKETWADINGKSKSPLPDFKMKENYPASRMFMLVHLGAGYIGIDAHDVMEKFGEFIVPDLLSIYKSYVNPTWKTFDLLVNTEIVMHKAVRIEQSKANPPVINVRRVHNKLLIIDYYSRRKMASLAIGIIRGIALFYNEADKVVVIPPTDLDEENVRIRVEFK